MALAHSPLIVTGNLVCYIDAANSKSYSGTGNVCSDLTKSNTGTLTNSVSYESANNGAFVFNTVDNYITMGNSYSIPGAITLLAWMYRNTGNGGMIFSNGTQYGLFAGGSYWYWDANPNWVSYTSTTSPPANQWCLYGVSHTPGSATAPTFYVNNNSYSSTGLTPTPRNAGGNGDVKLGE